MILANYLGLQSSNFKIYTKFQTLAPNSIGLHSNYDVTLVEEIQSYMIRQQNVVWL